MVHIVPHAIALGISPERASIAMVGLGGAGILGRIILGNASDRIGNKRVFFMGFVILMVSLAWLIPAREEWKLYLFSAVFGFGFAGMETSESPTLAWLFGLKSHGLVFGVISLFFTIGASLIPLMTGYIFDVTCKYQVAFVILTIIGVAGLILTSFLRYLVSPESSTSKRDNPLVLP